MVTPVPSLGSYPLVVGVAVEGIEDDVGGVTGDSALEVGGGSVVVVGDIDVEVEVTGVASVVVVALKRPVHRAAPVDDSSTRADDRVDTVFPLDADDATIHAEPPEIVRTMRMKMMRRTFRLSVVVWLAAYSLSVVDDREIEPPCRCRTACWDARKEVSSISLR